MSPLISSAKALYLGTTAVSRVYAGTAKVWPPATSGVMALRQGVEAGANMFSPTGSFLKQRVDTYAGDLHPDGATMVADFVDQVAATGANAVNLNTTQYTANVFHVAPGTQRIKVEWVAKENPPGDVKRPAWNSFADSVPWPWNATPSLGNDRSIILYDPQTFELWEFWKVRPKPGRPGSENYYNAPYNATVGGEMQASFGGYIPDVRVNRGYFPNINGYTYGTAATSITYLGSAISVADVKAGEIDHAIAVQPINAANWNNFSWPAMRSDGNNASPIPEGIRFRFPPDLDIDALTGLNPFSRMVMRAVQKYGMVPTDKAGTVSLVGEIGGVGVQDDGTNVNPWPALRAQYGNNLGSFEVLRNIPWNLMEVMPFDWGENLTVQDTLPDTTPAGVDYSGVTTAATFDTTASMTKVSGTVTLSTSTPAPEGQAVAVRLTHTGTTDSIVEATFPAVNLASNAAYLRVPLRFPSSTEVAGAAPRSSLRYVELRVAESKTQYTAGHYVTHRISMNTDTHFSSQWANGTLDPAWATSTTGTPNLAAIGYARFIINLSTSANGSLVLDVGKIERVPKVGGKGRVVIGIDDGGSAAYTTFLPKMQPYGFPATLFPQPGRFSSDPTAMTNAQAQELQTVHGWQHGTHAYLNHLTTSDAATVATDLDQSAAKFASLGLTGTEDFAVWGGLSVTADVYAVIAARFRSSRFTENYSASNPMRPESLPLSNQYRSKCWLVASSDTLAMWQSFVTRAAAAGGVAEFCFHNDPTANFDDFLAWLKVEEDAGRIEVVTKAQALGAA